MYLGTSSWKYPGWRGQIYTDDRYVWRGRFSETRFDRQCLAEYAEVFKTVCVDAAYYRFPDRAYLEGLVSQVPPAAPHVWSWKSDDGSDMVFRMLGGGPRRLGVEYMEIGDQLASWLKLPGKTGVLVSSVDADGPAAKGGMKAGDVILKVGSEAIEDGEDLREAVAEAEGGQEITVTVQRDGRPLDLKVTLAKPETKVRRRSAGVSL